MKKKYFFLLFLVCTTAVSQQIRFTDNELVVKIKKPFYDLSDFHAESVKFHVASIDNLNSANHVIKVSSIGQHAKMRIFVFQFEQPIDVLSLAAIYKASGLFDYVEPNYIADGGGQKCEMPIFPNDARFDRQWGLYNNGTMTGIGNVTNDADTDMELAWDIQTGDPDMVIAISDSGLKLNHPDIASRVWINLNEIPGNFIDDDNNGFIDDVQGWDWVNNDNVPTDDLGHGTNVASIVGCISNNNSLFTGVNWNSKLMILKVLNSSNTATTSAMANSIIYAVDNGAKVITMSIGGPSSQLMQDAIQYTFNNDVLFTACTMNFNNNTPYYPSAYSTMFSNVIAVGSTNPDDRRTAPFFWSATSGSNYGNHVNVVAPGNYIYGLSYNSDTNANAYWGGTSQATPLVAALASLVWAQNPALTAQEVRSIIEDTAQDMVGNPSEDVSGFDQYMGHGRVNAQQALQAAQLGTDHFVAAQEFTIVNPVRGNSVELHCEGLHEGQYQVIVHSMDGKVLRSNLAEITAGENTLSFPYPSGNYLLTLKSPTYQKIFKVLKK